MRKVDVKIIQQDNIIKRVSDVLKCAIVCFRLVLSLLKDEDAHWDINEADNV